MSSPFLLDVNVLIALFEPSHVHHEPAHDWFADNAADGWATCPVTETGFVRVLANPAVGASHRAAMLVEQLRKFCAGPKHHFWDDVVSLTDPAVFDLSAATHRNLTDIYLLGLATKKGGRLATFDRSIPLNAVKGARRATLLVIAPAD